MVLGWCGLRRYLRGGLRAVFGRLEAILERLGASWGDLGTSWDGLEASWDVLGRSHAALEPSCSHLGAVLGRLGAILEPPWGVHGSSLGCFWPSWSVLKLFLVAIERTSKIIEKHKVFTGFFRFGAVWEGVLWRSWGVLDGLETS